jgi:hypothetical protein
MRVPIPNGPVGERPEQRPVSVFVVAGDLQVIVDALQGERLSRHVPDFGALAYSNLQNR